MNEKIKNWLKTNWFKAGLLIILIICIGVLFIGMNGDQIKLEKNVRMFCSSGLKRTQM